MPLLNTDGRDPVEFLTGWATAVAAALNAQLAGGPFVAEPAAATRAQAAAAVQLPGPVPETMPMNMAPARFSDRVGVSVVGRDGRQVAAAVLLVTPDNKADSDSALAFAVRAAGLMSAGAGVVIVDALPGAASWATHLHSLTGVYPITKRPRGTDAPVLAVHPMVHNGAELFGLWHHNVPAGAALPTVPVAVRGGANLTLDLESTYADAARGATPA
ncbi:hypothetical protein R5W23_000965 [Gemmata sp. JC673]|uniref:Uncharacterized protein n=1 Tax=Gemmata algarum TaxID=2975278 RepID=A0ABU5EX23_9BACT|nr:hypothetical protein [Gemmata algarum]MDY3559795.1 hypothetical protein [Gemmata algarum]